MRYFFVALLSLTCLSAADKPASAFDKPTLEAYLRHLLAMSPDVQLTIGDPKPSPVPGLKEVDVRLSLGERHQDETFFISNDGKEIVRGFAYNINQNPFAPELEKLHTDLSPSFGEPGAPVVMVVFSDFECPNCKDDAKILRDNIPVKFPKEVRLYFKDYPLTAIHPWAKPAAIDGRCVFRQSPAAFWRYYDWMYEHQGDITAENLKDKVMEWANTDKDLDTMQLGRCIETKATEGEVDKELAEGQALRIEGTPTIFVNGRRLFGNYPWANLEQIVNGELKYQQTNHDAGEKCCEISIPSPIKK
jgi:protein-disulfide isomerase